MWRPGSKLLHPFNPELGIGIVREVEGRFLRVDFPIAGRELRLSSEASGLTPLILPPGAPAQLIASDEEVEIEARQGHGYRLRDGRVVDDAEIWPLEQLHTPIERLAALEVDRPAQFANRVAGLRFAEIREAQGLGPFLGGRIELFPHQLFTAEKAFDQDPVRWLLADEVGLGKTIEACLILSALIRTRRAERALIVAPETLAVQWLGELYRKFHQVFVLLDEERVEAVSKVVAEDANPFEVYPFAVVTSELLEQRPELAARALDTEHDLVVVDEAHRLSAPAAGRAIGPLVRHARHALLLTATPLQADRRGFHQLLELLHPRAFADFGTFDRAIDAGEAVLPCTSAVRRRDLGGLPPRVPRAVRLGRAGSGPAEDPRAAWLAEQVPLWSESGEKALVFVHETHQLLELKEWLEGRTRIRLAAFHGEMETGQRDIEVAQFRETRVPVLLASDAGAEGRNFQFCERMIHYDLPADPVVLEQRIGRLDRIGRSRPVEIVYFQLENADPDLGLLYEKLDLFGRPSAGLDACLFEVRDAVRSRLAGGAPLELDTLIAGVERAREAMVQDLPRVLYRDAYQASQAESILARVPRDLETAARDFCVGAALGLGIRVVDKAATALFYVELGGEMTVEVLPGVPSDARYLGSFDRAEAVRREEIEFFASGHPLVEGLLAELEDGDRGRTALLELPGFKREAAGLLAVFRDGSVLRPVVIDTEGEPRPAWVEPILRALPEAIPRKTRSFGFSNKWSGAIQRMGAIALAQAGDAHLEAAAFFHLRPGQRS